MTKEVYIAYFDLLGFKEFIKNNTEQHIDICMGHIFRDMELALSLENLKKSTINPTTLTPNISDAKVNCVNISDTVLYWSNDLNINDLYYLFLVSFLFNQKLNNSIFPVRGCLVKGNLNHVMGKLDLSNNALYAVQCPYGKGLVMAHEKAESQQWAGTVIDQSVIQDLKASQYASSLDTYCISYRVPYKKSSFTPNGNIGYDEYVFKLVSEINNTTHLKNIKKDIDNVFSKDNKPTDREDIQQKIENTQKFIDFIWHNNKTV